MKINFVTPRLSKDKYTGGILCILQHANFLSRKGHDVKVIPFPGSDRPEWIDCDFSLVLEKKSRYKRKFRRLVLGREIDKTKGFKSVFSEQSVKERLPSADITIATAWQTVDVVFNCGKGKKAFFVQHFEPIFENDLVLREKAASVYNLPIYKLANSSWLKNTITEFLALRSINEEIFTFSNSIDLDCFRDRDCLDERKENHVVLISYGGRNVEWKGFSEMAEAVAIARGKLPDYIVEWQVYGSACLPPDNSIAPYTALGFLRSPDLADAYNRADILLSASWYESYPLFPLEGMATGLAVICGKEGTEDYACHGKNVEWIDSRSPSSIAEAIIRLVKDKSYREMLSKNASRDAINHDWRRASDSLEKSIIQITSKESDCSIQEKLCNTDLLKILNG